MGQAESKMESKEESRSERAPVTYGEDFEENPISTEDYVDNNSISSVMKRMINVMNDALLDDESDKENFLEKDLNVFSQTAFTNNNESNIDLTYVPENVQTGIENEGESSNQLENVSNSFVEEKIILSSVVSDQETPVVAESLINRKIDMLNPDFLSTSVKDITNDFKDNQSLSAAFNTDTIKDIGEQSTSSNADLIKNQQAPIENDNERLLNDDVCLDDQPKISDDLKLFLYNDFKTKINTWETIKEFEANWISSRQNLFIKSIGHNSLIKEPRKQSSYSRSTSSSSSVSNESYASESYGSESSLEKIILKLYPKEKPPEEPLANPDDYKEALLHTNALIFAGSLFLKSFAEHGRYSKMARNLVDLLDTMIISIGHFLDEKSKDPFPKNIDCLNFNNFHEIRPQYLCITCHQIVAYKIEDVIPHIVSGHRIICKNCKKKDQNGEGEAKQEKRRLKKERRAKRREKKKILKQNKLQNGDKSSKKQEESSMLIASNMVDNDENKEESPSTSCSSISCSSSLTNQIPYSLTTVSLQKTSEQIENMNGKKNSSSSTSRSSSQVKVSQPSIKSKPPSQQNDPTKLQQGSAKKKQENSKIQQQIGKREQHPSLKTEEINIPKLPQKPPPRKEQQKAVKNEQIQKPFKREQQKEAAKNERKVPIQEKQQPESLEQEGKKLPKRTRQRQRKSANHSYHLPKKARALINNNMEQFFIDHVLMSKALQHLTSYDVVEKQLMQILKEIFPNHSIKLYKFGSRISGIGNRDSDLDIFVDIDNTFSNLEMRGSQETIAKIVKLSNALKKSRHFRNPISIPHARVPIVKTTNVDTNIDLDIGFSNSLGYCNTKLVAYFMEMQPIARCLCVFMKKWLDRCKFSDSLSSYSIVMMVIYFMQVQKLLPPVQKLQICLPKKFLVGPWISNCAEIPLRDFGFMEIDVNASSVKLMLKQFFAFYSSFQFDKYIICPYFGQSNLLIKNIERMMPKRYMDFVRDNQEWRLEIENKPIVVQDPLQLSRNLMQNMTPGLMKIFKQYLHDSHQYFLEL